MSGFWLMHWAGRDGWVGCFRRFEWMAFFSPDSDSLLDFFVLTCRPGISWGGRREMNCNWDNGTLESDETTDDVGRVWEVMNLGDVESFFIFVAFGGGGLLEKYMRMVLVVFAWVFWSSAFFFGCHECTMTGGKGNDG